MPDVRKLSQSSGCAQLAGLHILKHCEPCPLQPPYSRYGMTTSPVFDEIRERKNICVFSLLSRQCDWVCSYLKIVFVVVVFDCVCFQVIETRERLKANTTTSGDLERGRWGNGGRGA